MGADARPSRAVHRCRVVGADSRRARAEPEQAENGGGLGRSAGAGPAPVHTAPSVVHHVVFVAGLAWQGPGDACPLVRLSRCVAGREAICSRVRAHRIERLIESEVLGNHHGRGRWTRLNGRRSERQPASAGRYGAKRRVRVAEAVPARRSPHGTAHRWEVRVRYRDSTRRQRWQTAKGDTKADAKAERAGILARLHRGERIERSSRTGAR